MRNTLLLTSILVMASVAACGKDSQKTSDSPKTKSSSNAPAKAPAQTPVKAPADKPMHVMAKATITASSKSKVAGTVNFMLMNGKVSVTAKITGLTPGEHGFHVHEKGDCSAPDAKSAGGHFNPSSVDHGSPKGDVHHAGDLGNITANAEGVAQLSVELPSSFLTLDPSAPNNIVGRAVVVHGGTDDLKSQPSGAAGPRVGCGVIKLSTGGM